MARIAFIGLGNMGLPMAVNLIKAAHQVEGVDVNPAAIDKLKAEGGVNVEFAHVAAARYELERSVSHFYPGLEADLLPRIDTAR